MTLYSSFANLLKLWTSVSERGREGTELSTGRTREERDEKRMRSGWPTRHHRCTRQACLQLQDRVKDPRLGQLSCPGVPLGDGWIR